MKWESPVLAVAEDGSIPGRRPGKPGVENGAPPDRGRPGGLILVLLALRRRRRWRFRAVRRAPAEIWAD